MLYFVRQRNDLGDKTKQWQQTLDKMEKGVFTAIILI